MKDSCKCLSAGVLKGSQCWLGIQDKAAPRCFVWRGIRSAVHLDHPPTNHPPPHLIQPDPIHPHTPTAPPSFCVSSHLKILLNVLDPSAISYLKVAVLSVEEFGLSTPCVHPFCSPCLCVLPCFKILCQILV